MRTFPLVVAALLSACGTTPPQPEVDAGLPVEPVDAGLDCNAGFASAPDVAFTERGPVRGLLNADGTRSFLGLPYAKPPLGALRWRPPVAETACWPAVREATQWTAKCPQLEQVAGTVFDAGAPVEGDEDCLTLNVFTPPGGVDGGAPVMVFIHGGGNTGGSAGEMTGANDVRLYDGATLALRSNAVVVTMQYRLGALGYLALSALDAESDAAVSGNYGILDQQLALQWVQRNAAHFGGDASRVMLFGESAGAVNTCMHLVAPASKGLFHRAVIESGSCAALPLSTKRSEGTKWLTGTPCGAAADVMACLRGLTPEQLIRAFPVPVNVGSRRPEVSWNPNVDGVVLPMDPLEALRTGKGAGVPVIIGSNSEETNLSMPTVTTEAEYRAVVVQLVGPTLADQVLQKYPVATYGTPSKALVQVTTDAFFGCQARMASRAAVLGAPSVPVFRYLFSRAPVPVRGAFHGVELPYVFQQLSALSPATPAGDLATEASVLGYWSRFAAAGDPNGPGALTWSRVDSVEPIQRLDATVSALSAWRNTECDFWDAIAGVSIPAP